MRRDDRYVNLLATTSISAPAAAALAGFLMVFAGVGKRRLHWRSPTCPVCHHPRGACTCRWR